MKLYLFDYPYREAIFKTKLSPEEVKLKLSAHLTGPRRTMLNQMTPGTSQAEINENDFILKFPRWNLKGVAMFNWVITGENQAEINENDFELKISEWKPKGIPNGKVQGQIMKDDGGTLIKIKVIEMSAIQLGLYRGFFLGAILIILVAIFALGIYPLRITGVLVVFLPALISWLGIQNSLQITCRYLIDFFEKNLKE